MKKPSNLRINEDSKFIPNPRGEIDDSIEGEDEVIMQQPSVFEPQESARKHFGSIISSISGEQSLF